MRAAAVVVALALLAPAARADPPPSDAFRELHWRHIGPYRGGRTKAATGVPGRPGTYYIGACNGGVFRSNDYGRTWQPIFDDQPTASIGAIAVAPSRPDVLYVGSGEGLQRPDLSTGDGVYKSTDAGRTWRHLGLTDGQQIPQIAVDPRDADRLFVAVLGHPYGPSVERGIFRSRDGGATFEKVLYVDPDTGGADVVLDPQHPDTVYAVLWESRQAPWEDGEFRGPGSGLFKTTDGGTTWRRLDKGLPTFADGLGRIGVTVAPSDPRRLFATVEAKQNGGLYRSDDAGASWTRINADERVTERGDDFAEVKVHPTNPDIVFTASVVTWKSTDGGRSFTALRGAPGGDDYHRLWIDPERPDTMLLAGDQGAIVTVNGGQTWSSWYNQPTAQMFHATTDNAFPYRVCGGQQESGSACVASRSPDGRITFRDWRPAGLEEYGYAAPDPRDPDIVFGGKVSRYDRRTGQWQDVGPRPEHDRVIRTQPLVFAPLDPRTLYFATSRLWRTTDGGQNWTATSPDLTRATWAVPANVGKYAAAEKPARRGVIYAVAPSPVERGTIWVGTDDGLIHVTRDGGRAWSDVTPPELVPWAKVSILDAGPFDAATAYAAVNTLRLDDLRPHAYRTHDGGKSWTAITAGLDGVVNVVRADPRRRGLLYAGTEKAVFVSFDDGDHWQPLRLEMPATSIRDLVVKDDDLVAATHGRGFWILDDVTPLRQLEALAADVALLEPAPAWRVRWSVNSDTPLPPDEPGAANPPDGAILDYVLAHAAEEVTLEILDGSGRSIRRFSSRDAAPPIADEGNIPRYWIRPAPVLAVAPGLHRFVWDLHGPPLAALETSFTMAAVPGATPRGPRGPWVLPGTYTVKLTASGQSKTRPLVVKMDPRVKTPLSALRRQLALSERLAAALAATRTALDGLRRLRVDLERRGGAEARELQSRLAALEGTDEPGPRGGPSPPTLTSRAGRLVSLLEHVQEADAAPTAQLVRSAERDLQDLDGLLARWRELEVQATRLP
jgi:photosystem II stability/assembly factor-like uncharacterized protein